MSKFKVGDKVYLECKISEYDERDNTYCVDYSDYHKFPHTSCWIKDDVLHTPDELYNKGLNDAWELVKKIVESPNNGGYTAYELAEIFGISETPILDAYTPQEALAKVKQYEEHNKIKKGDVVRLKGTTHEAILTRVTETNICFLFRDGSCGTLHAEKDFEKTGEHFDSIDEFIKS